MSKQCIRILVAGKNAGTRCSKKAYKGAEYCSSCKRTLAKQAAREELNRDQSRLERFQSKPKQRAERINKSVFAITINFQKTPESMDEDQKNKARLLNEYLFDRENILDLVECAKNGQPEQCDIINVRIGSHFEIGQNKGRLHIHGLVEIDHRTCLRIIQSDLRAIVNQFFGSRVHLNIQAKPQSNSSHIWERYMAKSANEPAF